MKPGVHIDLKNLQPDVKRFVKCVIADCKEYNVDLLLSDKKTVDNCGSPCRGFFGPDGADQDKDVQFAVACGLPEEQWLEVMLHESCHMDQWKEQCKSWRDCYKVVGGGEIEACTLIDLWLDHKIELSVAQLNVYMDAIMFVELDCEKRTVKKIKELGFDANISEYIQKANAYVLFHEVMKTTRMWCKKGKAPGQLKGLWSTMPNQFMSKIAYNSLPKCTLNLYLEEVYGQ